MKLTVADQHGNYITITDPTVGFNPEIVDTLLNRATGAIITLRCAGRMIGDDSAVTETGAGE